MRFPKYRKHSVRDRAFVEIAGKRRLLPGAYDSAESREAYAVIVAELAARPTSQEAAPANSGELRRTPGASLGRMLLGWLDSLKEQGRDSEYAHGKGVLAQVSKEDAAAPASVFGPKKLVAVQQRMIAAGWSRTYVNDQVQRLRRAFRWGVVHEIVDESVWRSLSAVPGVAKGRTAAPEPRDVLPAPVSDVAAAARAASKTVAAMIRVQYRTGMRSHHLCSLSSCLIDFTSHSDVWVYSPARHEKGRAKKLTITIGPKSQRVLKPLLDQLADGEDDAFVFSPRRACLEWGQQPSARVGAKYTTNSYRVAVQRACDRAGVVPFHPHQLRHSAGTNARRVAGLEAAQAVLGHDRADVTQIYAEKHLGLAVDVARRIG